MNKIVREYCPVSRPPENLRAGLPLEAAVAVNVEQSRETVDQPMTLEEIFAIADQFRGRAGKEIDEEIRKQRDEWDD